MLDFRATNLASKVFVKGKKDKSNGIIQVSF
jgi:hypothetical protein